MAKIQTANKTAVRLRSCADSMEKEIDSKINSGTSKQNPTRRRIEMARQMERDGKHLRTIQSVMRRVADIFDSGDDAEVKLHALTSRTAIERAWREGSSFVRGLAFEVIEDPIALKIRRAEQDLVGLKIPGFFPTQPAAIDRMLELAKIERGMSLLEPSAGSGALADRANAAGAAVECIERNERLRDLIGLKEHTLIGRDFLEFTTRRTWDRVLMNPPFEKGQDMVHTMRAFELLKPGGILVAVVGEGAFIGQSLKHGEFKTFLEDTYAHVERLPACSFKRSGTGANARLVQIVMPSRGAIPVFDAGSPAPRESAGSTPKSSAGRLNEETSVFETGPNQPGFSVGFTSEILGAADADDRAQQKLLGQALTLEMASKSTRRFDCGTAGMDNSPLFGGDKQEPLF